MGIITSRIRVPFFCAKSPEVYKKELESINKEIFELEKNGIYLHGQYRIIIDLIVTYSRVLYVLVAFVFFLSDLPSSFIGYVFFCGPLIIFHILVYAFKGAIKWYFDNEIERNSEKIKKLNFKKKNILSKVKETTLFNDAKEILEKYSPEKPVPSGVQLIRSIQGTRLMKNHSSSLDNVVNYVLGEDKSNALICFYCRWNNGLAPEEEFDYTSFRCCRCFNLNHPRRQRPQVEYEQKPKEE